MDSEIEKTFKMPDHVPEGDKGPLEELHNNMKKSIKSRPDGKWSLADFEIGCFLGRGKFGRVYLARDIHCHLTFALKLMHKSELVKNKCELQVIREIEIQSHLRHPNCLTLYTYFDDPRFIFLVVEYAAGGEMYNHLKNQPHGRFLPNKAAKYFHQVVGALEYCHHKKVIHRDIKPENILLSGNDDVKLSDFGWSVHAPSSKRRTMCGTLDYLPPEMVNHTTYDTNVDNWCLGVLLFEFLTGKPPFETNSTEKTYDRINALDYEFPEYVQPGARDLIQQMLRINANERISLKGAQDHYWVQEHYPEAQRELISS